MEFITFPSYGGIIPDGLKDTMRDKKFPQARYDEDVINYIKQNSVEMLSDLRSEENRGKFFMDPKTKGTGREVYYGYASKLESMSKVAINTIYPEKERYILTEYDGAETLKPVPEYKVIDETCGLVEGFTD